MAAMTTNTMSCQRDGVAHADIGNGHCRSAECIPIDQGAQYICGEIRRADRTGQHIDDVEDAELADEGEHGQRGEGGREQREDDAAETLPSGGAIDLGRLKQFFGNTLQTGQVDDDRPAENVPALHRDHGGQRHGGIAQPGMGEETQPNGVQQRIDDADVRAEHQGPDKACRYQRDDHRQEEDGAIDLHESWLGIELDGDEQANRMLEGKDEKKHHKVVERRPIERPRMKGLLEVIEADEMEVIADTRPAGQADRKARHRRVNDKDQKEDHPRQDEEQMTVFAQTIGTSATLFDFGDARRHRPDRAARFFGAR